MIPMSFMSIKLNFKHSYTQIQINGLQIFKTNSNNISKVHLDTFVHTGSSYVSRKTCTSEPRFQIVSIIEQPTI